MERLFAQIWTWVIIFWGWILNSYWWMIFTCWMRSPWKVGSGVGGSVHASQVDSLPRLVSVGNWKRLNSEKFSTKGSRLTLPSTSMSMLSSPIQSVMNHQGHHRCHHHQRLRPLMNNYHCDHHHSWTVTLIFINYRQHFLLRNHHPHHHHRHEHWRKSREPILVREWLFHLSSKNPPPALRAFCIYPIFIPCFEVTFLIAVTIKDVVQI